MRKKRALIDGSRLVIESLAQKGADVFIGYPITPANLLFFYAVRRFPIALPAPDEITTLQWMAGFSASGHLPVTATSFPGFALMVESLNMAYMMELPMVIVLAQRLGPSTGTATAGAQGDIQLIHGVISGGYPVPTLCISDFNDCWNLPAEAVALADKLRTPVIVLTSKEMIMTLRSFDLDTLPKIKPLQRHFYNGEGPYLPYLPKDNLVPEFLPVGNDSHQVRLTASTHDKRGLIQHSSEEAMKNTRRLQEKMLKNLHTYTHYELDEAEDAKILIFSYGITSGAAREAVRMLRSEGLPVSLLIAKTLFPVPSDYLEIVRRYEYVVMAEENLNGQYCEILFGKDKPDNVYKVNAIGRMITPQEIAMEVKRIWKQNF